MNEHNHEQDRIIQKAVKDYYDRIEIPDPTPSWQKVHVRLQKNRRKKKNFYRLKIVAAVIVAALVIDVAAAGNISKTYASMSTLFREVKDRIVEFFFTMEDQDTSKAKTSPPPETRITDEPASVPEETTLEVAKTKLSFPLLLPSFVPEHYSLDAVRIFGEANGLYHNVYLEYVNDAQDIFKISERVLEPGSTSVKSDISADAGTIKEIMIKSNQGVLVILPEGFVTLEWLTTDRIKVSVSGKLTESEILKLAESLQ